MSYPQDVDLSAGAVREPFASVTNAVKNPALLSLSQPGREDVQNKGGPATDAGQSQTTHTTDTDAKGGAHGDPSGPNAQALRAGLAAMGHTIGDAGKTSTRFVNADGMSVCSMGTAGSKTGDSAYGTANDHHVDHEVSHMGPWAQDKINRLKTTSLATIVVAVQSQLKSTCLC
ncbi:hypothetical protein V8C43DRAFT_274665 [Trichoderma afarasin]